MNLEFLPLSFSAGVATFFSPCFGAMLPAYISSYLGLNDSSTSSIWVKGIHGLSLGGIVSAGFLTSFGVLGVIFGILGTAISQYIPWAAVMVGLFMVVLGFVMLLKPSFSISLGGIFGRSVRLKSGSGLGQFYLYGIIYALCAAACALPIFLSVMMQSFINQGWLSSIVNFGAYGWGMSIMMLALSVALVYSKAVVTRFFPMIVEKIHRYSGIFMIVAGGYVLYYLLIYGRFLDDLIGR